MSLRYAILATEGAHDQAVLCRLLELLGMTKFRGDRSSLDSFWTNLVPSFPKLKGDNLYAYRNMHFPYFYTSLDLSVAVYQGNGNNLAQNLTDILSANKGYAQDIDAVGLIVDADTGSPGDVSKRYADKLRPFFSAVSDVPGTVTTASPRTGIYVLPDNSKQGTLDSVLVECAASVYPDHKRGAIQFLDSLDAVHKSHWKPSSHDKAIVSSIVSVLRPGTASYLSIAMTEDKWLSEQTMRDVAEVAALKQFIEHLLELPESSPHRHL